MAPVKSSVFDLAALKGELRRRLSQESYEHSVSVQETAERLADAHGVNMNFASAAGLLHDYAKEVSGGDLIRLAGELGVAVTWVDKKNPYLLHAPVGARLVTAELRIDERPVLDAIARHTYGAVNMTDLDRVVYLADAVEPGRKWAAVEEIRSLAERNLRKAFALAYQHQLQFIVSKRAYIHPVSLDVWNQLILEREEAGDGWS